MAEAVTAPVRLRSSNAPRSSEPSAGRDTTPLEFSSNIFGVGALADPGALADVARLAEDLGYHSVFVADHVVMPRTLASKYPYSRDGGFPYDPEQDWLDPLLALGYLARLTTNARIGTSIT